MLNCAVFCQTGQTGRAKTNEDRAHELLNDDKHTFEDLLNRDPESIANAKEFFALTSDQRLKQRVASILLSIGARDRAYFDYLATEALKALNDDMPWPTVYDKNGDKISKTIDTLNPAFLKWCKAHNQDPTVAFQAAYYKIPTPWYHLAAAGDPRAYDLLLIGLHSKNPVIASSAGRGLAKLGDGKAIDELIAAYHHAPAETRTDFAIDLLYFDDPRAQLAAAELMKDPSALAVWKKEIQLKGKKLLFGY